MSLSPHGAYASAAEDPAGSGEVTTHRAPQETMEARLERVAYRLRAASASRCKVPEMLTGLTLHDLGAYDARDRASILAEKTLTTGFGVRGVVAGSAGEAASLSPGDEIVEVNGRSLETYAQDLIGRKASYARTERFEDWLGSELASGAAIMLVRRGANYRQVSLSGQPGCGGKPVFFERGGLNAWSDGKYVAVTARMMAFARDDSELAFVVAHEMSHNILDHAKRVRGTSMLLAEFGLGSSKVKRTEVEADSLGAELVLAAGFDTQGAVAILKRSGRARPFDLALTHPGPTRRIAIVNAAVQRNDPIGVVEVAASDASILSLLLIDQARARTPDGLSGYAKGSFTLVWSADTFAPVKLALADPRNQTLWSVNGPEVGERVPSESHGTRLSYGFQNWPGASPSSMLETGTT